MNKRVAGAKCPAKDKESTEAIIGSWMPPKVVKA